MSRWRLCSKEFKEIPEWKAATDSVKSLRILNVFGFLALMLQIHFLYKLEEVASVDKQVEFSKFPFEL